MSVPFAQALAARHDESGVRFFARRALFLRAFQASALVRPICERRLRAFAACGRLFFCRDRALSGALKLLSRVLIAFNQVQAFIARPNSCVRN